VTGGGEQNQEEEGAIYAGAVQKIGANEEEEYEYGRGVCWYEKEG
jgi:hypothetical protein